MGRTKIEWATHSWNPITGCTPVSEGCARCYARRMAKRLAGRFDYPESPHEFDVTVRRGEFRLGPKWPRGSRVFIGSMGDVFHDDVPTDALIDLMKYIFLTPASTFLILTKRADRMQSFMEMLYREWRDIPNLWLGVSVENQARADERIPVLLDTPAAVHFVSAEPLLGPISLREAMPCPDCHGSGDLGRAPDGRLYSCEKCHGHEDALGNGLAHGLDLCISGSETGPGKRPMDLDWAQALRDECASAGVPFFFKVDSQGNHELDGRVWEEMPEVRA